MRLMIAILCVFLFLTTAASAESIWIEGERPTKSTMNRHPWWYDQVKKDQLSGGDWISNFEPKKPGEAEYSVTTKQSGKFEFWVRANPIQAKLSYRLNDAEWTPIDFDKSGGEPTNIAADGKLDLRFIAWVKVCDSPVLSDIVGAGHDPPTEV